MTTNTEQTAPEVPAWLNLDGFCPPEIREKITAAADALEALLAYADPICREAYEAMLGYDAYNSVAASHKLAKLLPKIRLALVDAYPAVVEFEKALERDGHRFGSDDVVRVIPSRQQLRDSHR